MKMNFSVMFVVSRLIELGKVVRNFCGVKKKLERKSRGEFA